MNWWINVPNMLHDVVRWIIIFKSHQVSITLDDFSSKQTSHVAQNMPNRASVWMSCIWYTPLEILHMHPLNCPLYPSHWCSVCEGKENDSVSGSVTRQAARGEEQRGLNHGASIISLSHRDRARHIRNTDCMLEHRHLYSMHLSKPCHSQDKRDRWTQSTGGCESFYYFSVGKVNSTNQSKQSHCAHWSISAHFWPQWMWNTRSYFCG